MKPIQPTQPPRLLLLFGLPLAGIFLAHFGLLASASAGEPSQVAHDLLIVLEALLAAGSFFLAALRMRSGLRLPASAWFWLALAYLFEAAGFTLWAYFEWTGSLEPFPSPADLFYLLFYPAFILAILRLPSIRLTREDLLRLRLGSLVVLLSAGLMLWNYLLAPMTRNLPAVPEPGWLISLVYPLFGLMLLWVLTSLLFKPPSGVPRPTYLLLIFSLAIEIGVDTVFTYQTLYKTYTSGGLLDLGWSASLLVAALAGLYQAFHLPALQENATQEGAGKSASSRVSSPSLSRKAALYFPSFWVLLVLGVLVCAHYNPLPMNFGLVALFVTLIIVLLLGLQHLIFQENQRMYARLQHLESERAMQDSFAYFQALIENSSDPLFVVDRDGKYYYASPAVERILGFQPHELIGTNLCAQVHPSDRERVLKILRELSSDTGERAIFQYRYQRKDGQWLYLESEANNRLDDRLVNGIVINSRDISEQVQAYSALKESEERYALAAQAASDGLWDWDLKENRFYLSDRWKALVGFQKAGNECTPEEMKAMIFPEDLDAVVACVDKHLQGLSDHFEVEHRMGHPDGSWRWMLTRGIAVRDAQGRPTRIVGSQSDITFRKQTEERLVRDAFYDGLTGLPNRALFVDRLAQDLERLRRRSDYGIAVLFLDLDLFKVINDSLGHLAGDEILKYTADVVKGCVRAVDTVARMGGDEFVILLEDINAIGDAVEVADRIHEGLKKPVVVQGRPVYLSVSIGIVHSQDGPGIGYMQPEELLRDADTAMYAAKARGKACTVLFDPSMRIRALERLELDSALRGALEKGEFRLHYQPILSLKENRLVGFEALLRWDHPQRGLVPPGDFIPVAEETGLIARIGDWVLSEACRQARRWQEQYPCNPPLTVHVNLSGRQLVDPSLADRVAAVLEACGLEASSLKLEITESVLIQNLKEAIATIERLKELGVMIHIDDFGTGYSSLSYIQRLPVDAIKIDRSFISGSDELLNRDELLKSIIQLAQSLGLNAIAEGVETDLQLERLKELDCPYGQGYYICRPMPPEAAEALLQGSSKNTPQTVKMQIPSIAP